jgi:hypothetical protein
MVFYFLRIDEKIRLYQLGNNCYNFYTEKNFAVTEAVVKSRQ